MFGFGHNVLRGGRPGKDRMDNARHGVNQTFWTAAAGVLKDVVWEQLIAVAIVLTVVRLTSLLMKRDTS
jgi:hypothetical protein